MNNETKIKGILDAIALSALALSILGYCTPAPADEHTPEDRAAVQFERYKEDSDRYADRLYWQEQRTQRELDRQRERDWHRIYEGDRNQKIDKHHRNR